MVSIINSLLGYLTLLGHIILLGLMFSFWFKKKKASKKVLEFVSKRAFLFSLVISLTAMLGSLFYSDIAGYEPCKLCWYQRIFMYPQVFLLWLAIRQKDKSIGKYILMMSLFGGAIAGYHYLLQLNIAPSLPCSAVGYSVSCSQRFVMQFGYITIPLMSFTAFLLIIFFIMTSRKTRL